MNQKINLHLGCGSKKIKNFINVDIRPEVTPDLIDDIALLHTITPSSVDLIYTCHALEHFGRSIYKTVLMRWYEVLKKDGILRISVPNFEAICTQYLKNKNLPQLLGLLYGGQNYKENFHYCTFDFKSLEADLLEIGFTEVKLYDWRTTDHSDIDDFSQAYIPHMDKEHGMLMSLNIEAKK